MSDDDARNAMAEIFGDFHPGMTLNDLTKVPTSILLRLGANDSALADVLMNDDDSPQDFAIKVGHALKAILVEIDRRFPVGG